MKSADAKNPQFDGAWWKKCKAKPADPSGALEKALKAYEGAVKTFIGQGKVGANGDVEGLEKCLNAIIKTATAEKTNKNLGLFQKDTLVCLGIYIKIAGDTVKHINTFEKSPIMTSPVDVLVKNVPQFKEYCTKNYQAENFNFLALMYKNAMQKFVFENFVKPGSKFQANLPASTANKFLALEKSIAAGTLPDNDKTWKTAPWAEARTEIERLLRNDVLPRFRNYMWYVLMKDKLP